MHMLIMENWSLELLSVCFFVKFLPGDDFGRPEFLGRWRACSIAPTSRLGAVERIFSNDGVFLPYRGTGAVGTYWNGSPSAFLGVGFSASCEEDAVISVIRMQLNLEKTGSADSLPLVLAHMTGRC